MPVRKVLPWLLGSFLAAASLASPPQPADLASMPLEDLMNLNVQTAALHPQSIATAPSAVTVVTQDEIRKYGYRTLGEVLAHVRGFYLTYDHTYYEAGTGGLQIPGDWSTRILVLINGHAMTENIFGSACFFGEDFALDMSLVDRIEIARGTASALYGSNGIFATINVITKSARQETGTEVRLETGTLGERKLTVTQQAALPRQMSLLVSGTVLNDAGQHDIYFPEFDSPGTNNGHAINMDGQRGYKFFASLDAGNWQIFGLVASRVKIQPISWADTVFNDRGTRATDNRGLVDALYTREFDSDHVLRWRLYYDGYRYHGDYRYPMDGGGIDTNQELDAGDWAGSQLTYRFPLLKGDLTAGLEAKFDLRALQQVQDVLPVFSRELYVNKRDKFADGFLQQEWSLGQHWSFNLGGRYDWSGYRSESFSPRSGIVFRPDLRTSVKLIYGHGFRNPNANELFFSDGFQAVGNPSLRPERAENFEAVVQRSFGRSWNVMVSGYSMLDKDIIVQTYTSGGLIMFQNNDRFHGKGIGVEASGKPLPFLEISANFEQQKAFMGDRSTPANSPGEIGQFRFAVPLARSRLSLSGGLVYVSERRSLAGARIAPVCVPEATVTSTRFLRGVQFQAGVRNLANISYVDPVGLTPSVDMMARPGRTFFFTLSSRFESEKERKPEQKGRQ